jgi:hypothetical protein
VWRWRYVGSPVPLRNPVAGQPAKYVPSERGRELVVAATFTLTTAVAVADRFARVVYLDRQGRTIQIIQSPFKRQAAGTQVASFGLGGDQFGADNAAAVGGPLPELWLSGAEQVQLTLLNIQAADTITHALLWVAELGEDD